MTQLWPVALIGVLAVAAAGYGMYVLFPGLVKPRWSYFFGVTLAIELGLFLVAPLLGWWLPKGVSTYSDSVDALFYGILAVTGVTFVGVSIAFTWALFRYSADPNRRSTYTHGSHKLELIWTAVPAAVLLVLSVVQIPAWLKVKNTDWLKQAFAKGRTEDGKRFLQMEVVGRQWEWRIRYPGSKHYAEWMEAKSALDDVRLKLPARPDDVRMVNEIHCFKGQKVLIHLRTQDVLHSFFLPQMRLKQDALPGKTIPVWFEATEANCHKEGNGWKTGVRYDADAREWKKDDAYLWELTCAEFCGARHSLMRGRVYVHETEEDFLDWLKAQEMSQGAMTP